MTTAETHVGEQLQTAAVVVEEHHADDFDAVAALFELGQDHLAELITGGMSAGAEDVRDLHESHSFQVWWLIACSLALQYASSL